MTNQESLPPVFCFFGMLLTVCGWLLVPNTSWGQSEKAESTLQQLLVKANGLENQFKQVADIDQKILLQEQIIEDYQAMIAGLEQASPSFLSGSTLQGSNADAVQQSRESLEQNVLHKSFALSQMYQQVGKYSESQGLLEKVAAKSEIVNGTSHLRTLEYRLKLGVAKWLFTADESQLAKWKSVVEAKSRALQAFGKQDFSGAETAFLSAINTLEELGLQESMAYGEALANFAELLSVAEKLDEAEPMFLKAIEVNDGLYAKNGSVNANMRRSFSEVCRRLGKHKQAVTLLVDADSIYVATGNEKSLDRAFGLYLKGTNLHQLKQDQQATKEYIAAVRMLMELGQSSSPLIPALEKGLTDSYKSLSDVTEPPAAVAAKTFEIGTMIFADSRVDLADWLITIAKIKGKAGEQETGLAIYEQAKKLMESMDGFQQNQAYVSCLADMAMLNYSLKKMDMAIGLTEQSTRLAEEIAGKQSMFYASLAQNLSTLYVINGDHEKAEAILAELNPYLKTALGETDISYLRVLNDRAENFARTGNWDAAIKQWTSLKTLQQNNDQVPKGEYVRTLESLQMAFEKTGDADAVNRVKQELANLK